VDVVRYPTAQLQGVSSWSSCKQLTVAASTMQGEYMASASEVKEALWLLQLRLDLDQPANTTQVLTDMSLYNQSAVKLLKHPISSMRSNNTDFAHHFGRARVAWGGR